MIEAAGKIGLPYNTDLNGVQQEGIGMSQVTIAKGRRQSTAFAYLDPAREGPISPSKRARLRKILYWKADAALACATASMAKSAKRARRER